MALISVLFITALVVAIITAISHRQTLDIQLTGNLVFRSQAFQYAKGAEIFASEMLFRDFEEDGAGNVIDGPNDYWVKYGAALPMDNGLIEVELYDLQGLYNINNLIDEDGKVEAQELEYLKRIFNAISMDESYEIDIQPEIAESLADWVDQDNSTTGLGSEEGDYLIKAPAYRTPNYFIFSIDEIRLIQDISSNSADVLETLLSTLPTEASQINVNLAPGIVLQALDSQVQKAEIDNLISQREEDEGEFKNVNDFLAHPAFAGVTNALDASRFTVFSSYFLLKSRVTLGDRVVQMYSVLWRDPETGKTQVLNRDMSKRFKPKKPLLPI
jgi:general secretion pathway protein K